MKRSAEPQSAAVAQRAASQKRAAQMLCCECGMLMKPNMANTCVDCIRARVDITAGIPKSQLLFFCTRCRRYEKHQGGYVEAELESRDLLALCLRKMPQLKRTVKLTDAAFVWTEPHSRRVKIKLTIQKAVTGGLLMEQSFIAEFVVRGKTCEDCVRSEQTGVWTAAVQVRQRRPHARTLYFLEQLILKHGAHSKAIGIKTHPFGMDFFFKERSHGRTFCSFLEAMVPCRIVKPSKHLVSGDIRSNVFHYKFTFLCEIIPVCKDDLVVLPRWTASKLGTMAPLALVTRVQNVLKVVEIGGSGKLRHSRLKTGDIDSLRYFKSPFRHLVSNRNLVEFTILDIEPIRTREAAEAAAMCGGKYMLARAEIMRSNATETGDQKPISVTTHLGHVLHPGDSALGFDLANAMFNQADAAPMLEGASGQTIAEMLPEIVLVRKTYPRWRGKKVGRIWKVARIRTSGASDEFKAPADEGLASRRSTEESVASIRRGKGGRQKTKRNRVRNAARREKAEQRNNMHLADGEDYELFLRDLEEDKEMRSEVRLYRDHTVPLPGASFAALGGAAGSAAAGEGDDDGDSMDDAEEDRPEIGLDELLDDLTLEEELGEDPQAAAVAAAMAGEPLPSAAAAASVASAASAATAATAAAIDEAVADDDL